MDDELPEGSLARQQAELRRTVADLWRALADPPDVPAVLLALWLAVGALAAVSTFMGF